MIVVSDTSSVTALIQIGKADLLQQLYGEILIPQAVRDELLKSHASLPLFLDCQSVGSQTDVNRLLAELDRGEAEAIILAKERHADALLIDELDGRAVARREGVIVIGLLGVLVQAKQGKFLGSVRDLVKELERVADFHLSEEIKMVAFRKAGEI